MIEVLPAHTPPIEQLKLPPNAACQPCALTPPASPRKPASAEPATTEPATTEQPYNIVVGASYKALTVVIIRASADLQSDKVGKLEPGEVIVVLGTKDVGSTSRVRCVRGWASVTSKSGALLLERTTSAQPEPEPEPEPESKLQSNASVGADKVRFKGRHLDFLRNMAAARKKAQGMAEEAAEAQAATRARLQAKVLSRCKEVAAESLGALPPQQQALVAASAANATALGSRAGDNGKTALSMSLPRQTGCAETGRTKTFSLDGRSSSAGGMRASGGSTLLRELRSSREQALFQSVSGATCGCDHPAPLLLRTTGKRGRTAAAAAQKRVGRASVVFASDVDAEWNVQAHSLQRRLTATNMEEAKAAFLADPTVDPVFTYEHDIESHQLERFPVCKRWLPEAERLLDAVVSEFGSEAAYHKAMTKKRKQAVAAAAGLSVEAMDTQPMTPEELVSSAEAFLMSCQVGGSEEGRQRLVEKLNIHFTHRKTRAMSVRGTTLNVPLPITLSINRVESVWYHELGTHFIRNAINEPVSRAASLRGVQLGTRPRTVPFGAQGGVNTHLERLKKAREVEMPKTLGPKPDKTKSKKKKNKQTSDSSDSEEDAVVKGSETDGIKKGDELVVVNKATVRMAWELDSEEADFGRLEVGEVIEVADVVEPAAQLPCTYVCLKRAAARKAKELTSELAGHVEEGETVEALEECRTDGRRRIRCKIGWLTVENGADAIFFRPVAKPRVAFSRAGTVYWVSTASTDGRPLLVHINQQTSSAVGSSGAKKGGGKGLKHAGGTRNERVAAHVREKEEHTSEEGVAVVNQALAEPDMRLVRPALMYVAAAKSWELGFVGLWDYLGRWVDSPARRWTICARVKGGLRDTSKVGGFCRDQAYWAGAVHYLRKRNVVDLRLLHMGRINIDEAVVPPNTSPESWPSAALDLNEFVIPPFLADLDEYKSKLDQVAAANFLDD